MISGATQSGFHFLQEHINFPSDTSVDFDPHKLINSNKQIKILWAHYAHDQPIFLNVNWDKITHIVCVSNWQKQQFIKYLKIPKHMVEYETVKVHWVRINGKYLDIKKCFIYT